MVRNKEFSFLFLLDFYFLALSLSVGHSTAHEDICLSVGKRLISVPITEMTAYALVFPIPVTS